MVNRKSHLPWMANKVNKPNKIKFLVLVKI